MPGRLAGRRFMLPARERTEAQTPPADTSDRRVGTKTAAGARTSPTVDLVSAPIGRTWSPGRGPLD